MDHFRKAIIEPPGMKDRVKVEAEIGELIYDALWYTHFIGIEYGCVIKVSKINRSKQTIEIEIGE